LRVFTIAHLSDVRFGAIDPKLPTAVLADLRKLGADLVVVSGNLTRRAGPDQLAEARKFLDRIPGPQIVVPGPRDAQHLNLFRRFFRPFHDWRAAITPDMTPFFTNGEVSVLGINTARVGLGKKISTTQAGEIRTRLGTPGPITVLVSHHPLVPRASTGTTTAIRPETKELHVVAKCVDVVLAGHQGAGAGTQDTRVAYRVLDRQTIVAQAAVSPASSGRDSIPYYNAVRIDGDRVSIAVRLWRGTAFEEQGPKSYRFTGTHWDKYTEMPPDFQWTDSSEMTPARG
jgi:hypothetical protein